MNIEHDSGCNQYLFTKDIKENDSLRTSFNLLSRNTFGLDFEPWYQNGYWGNDYIPYVLVDKGTVVSNVSVNIINTRWKNRAKRFIQLGTIMTDKKYRNKGLSRWLIEKVLNDWKDQCDGIYLFANDGVLDFYPKFGFEKALEYQCEKTVNKKQGMVRKLDMSLAEDRMLLFNNYKLSNPFSELPMEGNSGLLMFYCSKFMRESIYYVEKYRAVVIAEYKDEKLICYDVFCAENYNLDDIIGILAKKDTITVTYGFTPKQTEKCRISVYNEEDTTLFIFRGKENLFIENHIMFPLLSHA